MARALLRLTANSPRHLNYSNVSPLFIADCQATTSGKETDNRRSSAAFEIGTVDWRTAEGRHAAGQWHGGFEMIIRDATTPLDLKYDACNNAADDDEQVCNLAGKKDV